MTHQNTDHDRRERARFKLKPGTVVLLGRQWPHSTIVGEILDISTDGVAVQYVGDEPAQQEPCELGIASTERHTYLGRFPATPVSDFTMAKIPFGSLVPRRLALRFGPLDPDQTADLENYIKENAVTKV
ncbi:MAG: PilZ domain-containing protein [Deltaproteobacteria bacterium]|nr:PilZ domain-containing protein [Deltaproteobacteria bacterium]